MKHTSGNSSRKHGAASKGFGTMSPARYRSLRATGHAHVVRSDDAATMAAPHNCSPAHHYVVTRVCPASCANKSLAILEQRFLTPIAL